MSEMDYSCLCFWLPDHTGNLLRVRISVFNLCIPNIYRVLYQEESHKLTRGKSFKAVTHMIYEWESAEEEKMLKALCSRYWEGFQEQVMSEFAL